MLTLPARILDKIEPEPMSGCWLWTGGLRTGYPSLKVRGKHFQAHRFTYELLRGQIPTGLELDHLCRLPICVNPHHLEPVTHTENLRRGIGWSGLNAKKTHCPKGHPYDVLEKVHSHVGRRCGLCRREHRRNSTRRWRASKASA